MTNTPADILRAARLARGFASAADCARSFGWNVATYTSHENGTRNILPAVAERYGNALGIDPRSLLGWSDIQAPIVADQGVEVTGTAAWGVWRDTLAMHRHQVAETIDVPRDYRGGGRRALLVADQSINKAIQESSFAIYRPIGLPDVNDIPVGKLLVISQTKNGMKELSIRRIQSSVDGTVRLSAHSTDKSYREILVISTADKHPSVTVIGVVVGSYTPL